MGQYKVTEISNIKGMVLVSLFMIGLGIVQVYSSSFVFAIESFGNGHHFVIKQAMFALFALVVMFLAYKVPLKYFKYLGPLAWLVAFAGIILTLHSSIGVKVGGSFRWVQLPFGLRFEPSELLKVSYPLIVASLYSKSQQDLAPFFKILKALFVLSPLFFLMQQPDFGSFVICSTVLLSLLFVFGLPWKYVFSIVATGAVAGYFLVINVPYRYARLMGYLDPWSDPSEKGFQVIQSMLSFHSGGMTGVGLGQGQGKLFFLPEAHTDFTLAVFGEEWGFLGVLFIILLYGYMAFRGFQISAYAKERSHQIMAIGLTVVFTLNVFINMGVVLGALPTKGLTLPFLSYGGSSLLCVSFLIGILLNIDKHSRTNKAFAGYKI